MNQQQTNTPAFEKERIDLSKSAIVAQVPPLEQTRLEGLVTKTAEKLGPPASTEYGPQGGFVMKYPSTPQVAQTLGMNSAWITLQQKDPGPAVPVAGGRGISVTDKADGVAVVSTRDPQTGNGVAFEVRPGGVIGNYAVFKPGTAGNPATVINFVDADGKYAHPTEGTRGSGAKPTTPKDYYRQLLGN